jgi:hypothetical protein
MAALTGPELLACYTNALDNWRFDGYMVFEKDAAAGLRKWLGSYTQKAFKELLHHFVVGERGEIDQVVEQRENWRHKWPHHYDLRPTVDGVKIYVETRLDFRNPEDPDDPVIYLVNIKPA